MFLLSLLREEHLQFSLLQNPSLLNSSLNSLLHSLLHSIVYSLLHSLLHSLHHSLLHPVSPVLSQSVLPSSFFSSFHLNSFTNESPPIPRSPSSSPHPLCLLSQFCLSLEMTTEKSRRWRGGDVAPCSRRVPEWFCLFSTFTAECLPFWGVNKEQSWKVGKGWLPRNHPAEISSTNEVIVEDLTVSSKK